MAVPRAVARFQRRVTNPWFRFVAAVLPGYGVLLHIGRRSGREYRTPLNVFRTPNGFAIVIAYGARSDWLRNVQAATQAQVIRGGRRYRVTAPRIVDGPAAYAMLPPYGKLISRASRERRVLVVDAVRA